jgi:dihydroneopterin aldolase
LKIEIENLTFKTIIGILDFERVKKQRVIVNLKAKYSYKNQEFINYVELCDLIKDNIKTSKFELLEDALISTADKILKKYKAIKKLEIKITKPDILKDADVSLSKKFKQK